MSTLTSTIVLPIRSTTDFVDPSAFVNAKSVIFDGVDEYLTFGSDSDIQFDKENGFTVSFWMKSTQGGTNHLIGNWAPSNGWRIRGDTNLTTTGNLSFQFTGSTGSIVVNQQKDPYDGSWHHIAMSYAGGAVGAAGVTFYFDGSVTGKTIKNDDLGTGEGGETSSLTIAAHSGLQQFYAGNIDEVIISNSVLDSSEITAIYNSGAPKDFTGVTGILHGWRMGDGDTFPSILDNIASLDGTMVNMESVDIESDVP